MWVALMCPVLGEVIAYLDLLVGHESGWASTF
jgi:hypothetical protein